MAAPTPPESVVGIGASAGGMEALELMLQAFTLDSTAFVLVMHLPREQKSYLASILARYTVLDVEPAAAGTLLASNHIYVVPASENVAVSDGRLVFEGYGRTPRGSRNIDHFFKSLAEHYGPSAVGVILSGANADGSAGLAAIRAAGGATFVQSAESALFAYMPVSASVSADAELDPAALGRQLMKLLARREAARAPEPA